MTEEPWGLTESWSQHMAAIARLHQSVDKNLAISGRLDAILRDLQDASRLLRIFLEAGTALKPEHLTRLNALIRALDSFASQEGL